MIKTYDAENYDIAVIGGGHAGIEAALAPARLGCKTVMFTINLDWVGNMPHANTKPKSIYVYKGKIVTDKAMLEEIKSFIQTSSSKSTKFGSEVEDIVLRDYKLENVVLLKQGSKEYNLMEHLFSAEQILEFIKSLL